MRRVSRDETRRVLESSDKRDPLPGETSRNFVKEGQEINLYTNNNRHE